MAGNRRLIRRAGAALGRHLLDPLAILISLILGAVGVAAAAARGTWPMMALATGVGIVAVVHTTSVGLNLLADRAADRDRPDHRSQPEPGLPADLLSLVVRAERAARTLADHQPPGAAGARLALADRGRSITRRLEGRARAVAAVTGHVAAVDADEMTAELERLRRAAADAGDDTVLRAERELSVQALEASLDALAGQVALGDRLQATVESTVLRLEAAAARAVLLSARRAAADGDDAIPGAGDEATALLDELEAASAGLDETEVLTRVLLDP